MSKKSIKITPATKLINIFFSNYIGWGINPHPLVSIILEYNEFTIQKWGDKTPKVTSNNEVIAYFIHMNKDIFSFIIEHFLES